MTGTRPQLAPLDTRRHRLWLGAIYVILIAVSLSPLAWVSVPPLVDYPNHLARMWVLAHPELPALAANYQPAWRLLPNLAEDLVVPTLALIMPVESAGRVFVALTLISLVLGTAALRWALQGKIGPWPLLSLLFLYNSALLWGFLNYLFALGVALLVFSLWVARPRWPRGLRLPVFSALAALLFVLHLFAFGLYGLLVGIYELDGWRRENPRRLGTLIARGVGLLQFGPALLLWLITLESGVSTKMQFGDLGRKLYAWLAPFALGFSPPLLAVTMVVSGVAAVLIAWRAHAAALMPRMRWPLAVIALVAGIMPFSVHGSVFADYRLPVALPFLAIAALEVKPVPRPLLAIFGALALVLFGTRIWATTEIWRNSERSFDEFRHAAAIIPQGDRLLSVATKMPPDWSWPGTAPSLLLPPDTQAFNHMALLAVIDRSVFVPSFFSTWTPVEPTSRNGGRVPQDIAITSGGDFGAENNQSCDTGYTCRWREKFDYLLWVDYGHRPDPLPAGLTPAAIGSFFTLYQITPD